MTDRLVELLQSDACRPLLLRLRKKLQRGETLTGRCRLSGLDRLQATRIAELTGGKTRGAHLAVDLDVFAQVVVNTRRFDSLEELVELACGEKIQNLRAAREKQSFEWQSVWEHTAQLVDTLGDPWRKLPACEGGEKRKLEAYATSPASPEKLFNSDSIRCAVAAMRERGWLRRLTARDATTAKSLLDDSFDLLRQLPVDPTPLPIFAAHHCGNAHALDNNTLLGRVLFKLLSHQQSGVSDQKKAVKQRCVWEAVGIVTDELSSTLLALNLPAVGDALSDRILREHLRVGMPARLTFRHLRLYPPTFMSPKNDRESWIYVCENPSVLAEAANRLAARCPPLICVEGQPSLACWILLERLCLRGYRLAYHGDFDWGGIRIANKIYSAFSFEPWRFTSSAHRTLGSSHRKLRPPASEALWDASLSGTIRRAGVSVEEETMIDDLLSDLEKAAHSDSLDLVDADSEK